MIRFLHEISTEEAGGKALGLKTLQSLGMRVPEAFVLIHPDISGLDDEKLKTYLSRLGEGPKAVRSSAVSEDGHGASFAGQFETYLNLRTFDDIKSAIIKCITAARSERVLSYSGNRVSDADLRLSVILQNMVDARVAGVVFSANPVNHRRDKILINAIAGHGEDLVSGVKDAHQYELYKSGSDIRNEALKNGHLLDERLLREILEGTLTAEDHVGCPVDLEWAVDGSGILHWLQVRPVTTLSDVHYNELDTVKGRSDNAWTLGNIGEMMPGVATPLTYSVTAEAIDYGMVILADRAGAYKLEDRTGPRYIQMFYNRLFINMSNMMDYPKRVWLNTPEDVQFALSGKVFPEISASAEASAPVRVINFFRQVINTLRGETFRRALVRLEAGYRIDTAGTPEESYRNIDRARHALGVGFGHHLGTSAQSGTLYSAIVRIMAGSDRAPSAHDHHIATLMLLDIPGIESADAVKSLERLADFIRKEENFASRFTGEKPAEALKMLGDSAFPEISRRFNTFLQRHGHRCVRESELREVTWEENPLLLIQTLQTRVRLGEMKHTVRSGKAEVREALRPLPFIKRSIILGMMKSARKAVARREFTKACSIRMVNTMRKAYRNLAKKLTAEGLLDDPDQVYFLTHREIGQLIHQPGPEWKARAEKRRAAFSDTDRMVFNEISFGIPEPLEYETEVVITEGQLKGTPVSSGRVTGRARIVHSLADAEQLQEGEIMVASFTDIGWTPYFSIISGLITEIGSPLSHGAVVAREYGIPAVVGAKGARKFLSTGDLVILDGNSGVIEKANP